MKERKWKKKKSKMKGVKSGLGEVGKLWKFPFLLNQKKEKKRTGADKPMRISQKIDKIPFGGFYPSGMIRGNMRKEIRLIDFQFCCMQPLRERGLDREPVAAREKRLLHWEMTWN